MEALSRPMAILIDRPGLAARPGAVLLALWEAYRRRLVPMAAIAWLLDVPYEYGMKRRVLCSGEYSIRVDLLVLYPALAVLALLGLISALRALGPTRR